MKFLLIVLTLVQFSSALATSEISRPQELDLVTYDLWNQHPINVEKASELQKTLKSRWSEEVEVALSLIE